jgi:Putative auto-transporter adhesin, head GIN domain
MNRCSALFLLAVAIVPVGGCGLPGIAGSGVPASRSVDAKDFTTVKVSGPFEVTLERGDKFKVTISSDDNLLQFIDVQNAAGKLSIDIQSGQNLRPKSGLKAKINMPAIEFLDLRGACSGSINGFKGSQDLKVNVEGASTITGEIQAGKLTLDAGGASQINLTGKAHECSAEASGASQFHLADLSVEKAVVKLDGASSGVVNASDRLDYELNGASHLDYRGNPKIGNKEVQGASSASQK